MGDGIFAGTFTSVASCCANYETYSHSLSQPDYSAHSAAHGQANVAYGSTIWTTNRIANAESNRTA